MHRNWLAAAILCGLAPRAVLANEVPSFFRPSNVTGAAESEIYQYTGSYYNGTAKVEFEVTSQSTRSNSSRSGNCSNFQGQTITSEFESIFAVVPKINSSDSVNRVNAIWRLWPQGYPLSSMPRSSSANSADDLNVYKDYYSMRWYLGSVIGDFFSATDRFQAFPLTVTKAHEGYYNVSANMSHSSTRPLGKFNVPSCNGTGSEVAYIHIENDKDANYDQDSSLWATYGFVFDSDGVNATFTSPNATLYATAGDSQEFQSLFFRGSLKVTVSGVIDPWHSDILVSDGATPSWNSTVGYNASYYAYSGASGLKSPPALMIAFAAGLLSATLILV